MTVATSPAVKRRYGVERVCAAFDVPWSTFYAWRGNETQEQPPTPAGKRGPKPRLTDAELLVAIREDLASSPFEGEGHRKVWTRLRVLSEIRVARKRVLRVMRENHLLSPHRVRQGAAKQHDGHILTDAPNVMWGTDGTRVFTVDDGWVLVFAVVEHWNAECLGWHVCKVGDRFNALQPVGMAVQEVFGAVCRDIARGIALRMNYGTQYLSDHFLNPIRFWGLAASFAFIEEPRDQWRRGAIQPDPQGAGPPRSRLPEYRGGAPGSARLRGGLQRALARRETRLQKSRPDAPGLVPGGRMMASVLTRTSPTKRATTPSWTRRRRQVPCPGNRVRYTPLETGCRQGWPTAGTSCSQFGPTARVSMASPSSTQGSASAGAPGNCRRGQIVAGRGSAGSHLLFGLALVGLGDAARRPFGRWPPGTGG